MRYFGAVSQGNASTICYSVHAAVGLVVTLKWNTKYFREQIIAAGLQVGGQDAPIVPVMLYNAKLANDMARDMYAEGCPFRLFIHPEPDFFATESKDSIG